MTTIAYKDGVVAYDSRVTEGSQISYLEYDKHRTLNGVHFFFAGAVSDYGLFMQLYMQGDLREELPILNVTAIIVDKGQVYISSIDEDGKLWVERIPKDQHYALGSGCSHAFTAMDMGASAKHAIKMAMLRDCKTGGRIRTYTVKEPKK